MSEPVYSMGPEVDGKIGFSDSRGESVALPTVVALNFAKSLLIRHYGSAANAAFEIERFKSLPQGVTGELRYEGLLKPDADQGDEA